MSQGMWALPEAGQGGGDRFSSGISRKEAALLTP